MDKRKPLPINPDLKEYALKMRKNQTSEEKKVWFQILKGRCMLIEAFALTTLGSRIENSPPPDQLNF